MTVQERADYLEKNQDPTRTHMSEHKGAEAEVLAIGEGKFAKLDPDDIGKLRSGQSFPISVDNIFKRASIRHFHRCCFQSRDKYCESRRNQSNVRLYHYDIRRCRGRVRDPRIHDSTDQEQYTGVYQSNNASRSQMRGRINRLGQSANSVKYILEY
jgi:hypothetical protein